MDNHAVIPVYDIDDAGFAQFGHGQARYLLKVQHRQFTPQIDAANQQVCDRSQSPRGATFEQSTRLHTDQYDTDDHNRQRDDHKQDRQPVAQQPTLETALYEHLCKGNVHVYSRVNHGNQHHPEHRIDALCKSHLQQHRRQRCNHDQQRPTTQQGSAVLVP